MPDVTETIYGAYSIVKNGTYRLFFSDEGGKRHFSAAWNAKDVPAGGTLAFSFDGDQGQVPGVIEMTGDFSRDHGQRRPAFCGYQGDRHACQRPHNPVCPVA